jgi:hypothetical protein
MVELLQGCFRWQPAALEPAKVEDIRMWLKRFKAGMTIFVPVLAFETPGYLLVKHSPPHDKAIALSHLVTFFAVRIYLLYLHTSHLIYNPPGTPCVIIINSPSFGCTCVESHVLSVVDIFSRSSHCSLGYSLPLSSYFRTGVGPDTYLLPWV